jgi:hypothetical protein
VYWKKLLKIPTSGRSPKAESRFDPADLAPFSVFRCNYRFDGDPDVLPARRFVCLAHAKHERSDVVITLKATSKLEAYRNNPARLAGVVVYPAGAIPFFEKDTLIQPDNPILHHHSNLAKQYAAGDLAILGMMPDGFVEELARAIKDSITMSAVRKRNLLAMLGLSTS